MRSIVEFFVRYPIWANSIIAIVLFFGIASFLNIKKSSFPETDPRNITVQVMLPGASPEEMEEGVTIKIEEAIKGIVGIEEIESVSSENRASVTITTFEGYDLDEVLTDVKNAVDQINGFPVAAEKPIIYKQKSTTFVASVGLRGKVDLLTLKRAAELIEDDFLQSGVLSQINVSGFPALEISIEVPEENLLRYGITLTDVANAVRRNNRDISGGTIKTEQEEISIRANAKELDPEQISNIILRANNDGSYLLLNDVGTVKLQFADVPNKVFSNNQRSVNFSIQKLPEEDIEEISQFLADYIEEFNATNENMELFTSFDFNEILQQRLSLLVNNGSVGLLLVLCSLGLFLSLRLSFWVAWGIPASFLGMFIVGFLYGITINLMSLFGMILVVGILVDDGIVIAENIYTHFERGKRPHQAAIDGTLEVLPAVFTSVTTTIIAFLPLIFLENRGFTEEMAIVVIASLAFSLVEAFLVLPAHLGTKKVLSRKEVKGDKKTIRSRLNEVIFYVRDKVYARALSKLIQWKWVSIAVPVFFGMVVIGLLRGGVIPFTYFPNIPFDNMDISLVLKPGTRENVTEDYLRRFQDVVWEVSDELSGKYGGEPIVQYIDLSVGSSGGRGATQSGGHAGNIRVNFVENLDERNISTFEVARMVRERIGPLPEAEKFTVGGSNFFGKPVSFALMGKNLEALSSAKEEFEAELSELQSLKDITDNSAIGQREIELELKPKAYFLGFNQEDITRQIRQGFFGEEAQKLQIGTDEVRVWVRYPQNDRLSISKLESMKIKDGNGNEYPLQELATYSIDRGVININHFNGKREIRVDADLENPTESVPPIIEKIEADILPGILAKYPSVSYSVEGQQRRSQKTYSSFMFYGILAFVMMILVITLSFRSFYQALLILLMIPLGVLCAIFGHLFHGAQVTIQSVYGMIALSGVIINDAVVMLDKYNRNLRDGLSVQEAAFEAGRARFRAILLTSITTVVGLFPIILESSIQAQFLVPMAISLAYGVLFGTFFILFFFPPIILVFNDVKYYIHRSISKVGRYLEQDNSVYKPRREDVEPTIIEKKRQLEF